MSALKQWITHKVASLLSDYIEGISDSTFEIGLGLDSGLVDLKQVRLHPDLFTSARLQLLSSTVSVRVEIPWRHLGTAPLVIKVHDTWVEARCENREEELTPEKRRHALHRWRRKRARNVEELVNQNLLDDVQEEDSGGPSLASRIGTAALRQLHVSLDHIDLRLYSGVRGDGVLDICCDRIALLDIAAEQLGSEVEAAALDVDPPPVKKYPRPRASKTLKVEKTFVGLGKELRRPEDIADMRNRLNRFSQTPDNSEHHEIGELVAELKACVGQHVHIIGPLGVDGWAWSSSVAGLLWMHLRLLLSKDESVVGLTPDIARYIRSRVDWLAVVPKRPAEHKPLPAGDWDSVDTANEYKLLLEKQRKNGLSEEDKERLTVFEDSATIKWLARCKVEDEVMRAAKARSKTSWFSWLSGKSKDENTIELGEEVKKITMEEDMPSTCEVTMSMPPCTLLRYDDVTQEQTMKIESSANVYILGVSLKPDIPSASRLHSPWDVRCRFGLFSFVASHNSHDFVTLKTSDDTGLVDAHALILELACAHLGGAKQNENEGHRPFFDLSGVEPTWKLDIPKFAICARMKQEPVRVWMAPWAFHPLLNSFIFTGKCLGVLEPSDAVVPAADQKAHEEIFLPVDTAVDEFHDCLTTFNVDDGEDHAAGESTPSVASIKSQNGYTFSQRNSSETPGYDLSDMVLLLDLNISAPVFSWHMSPTRPDFIVLSLGRLVIRTWDTDLEPGDLQMCSLAEPAADSHLEAFGLSVAVDGVERNIVGQNSDINVKARKAAPDMDADWEIKACCLSTDCTVTSEILEGFAEFSVGLNHAFSPLMSVMSRKTEQSSPEAPMTAEESQPLRWRVDLNFDQFHLALDMPHDDHCATMFLQGASVVLNHGVDSNLNCEVASLTVDVCRDPVTRMGAKRALFMEGGKGQVTLTTTKISADLTVLPIEVLWHPGVTFHMCSAVKEIQRVVLRGRERGTEADNDVIGDLSVVLWERYVSNLRKEWANIKIIRPELKEKQDSGMAAEMDFLCKGVTFKMMRPSGVDPFIQLELIEAEVEPKISPDGDTEARIRLGAIVLTLEERQVLVPHNQKSELLEASVSQTTAAVKVAVTWSGICYVFRQRDVFAIKDYINEFVVGEIQKAQQLFEESVSAPLGRSLQMSSAQSVEAFPDEGEAPSHSRSCRRAGTDDIFNRRSSISSVPSLAALSLQGLRSLRAPPKDLCPPSASMMGTRSLGRNDRLSLTLPAPTETPALYAEAPSTDAPSTDAPSTKTVTSASTQVVEYHLVIRAPKVFLPTDPDGQGGGKLATDEGVIYVPHSNERLLILDLGHIDVTSHEEGVKMEVRNAQMFDGATSETAPDGVSLNANVPFGLDILLKTDTIIDIQAELVHGESIASAKRRGPRRRVEHCLSLTRSHLTLIFDVAKENLMGDGHVDDLKADPEERIEVVDDVSEAPTHFSVDNFMSRAEALKQAGVKSIMSVAGLSLVASKFRALHRNHVPEEAELSPELETVPKLEPVAEKGQNAFHVASLPSLPKPKSGGSLPSSGDDVSSVDAPNHVYRFALKMSGSIMLDLKFTSDTPLACLGLDELEVDFEMDNRGMVVDLQSSGLSWKDTRKHANNACKDILKSKRGVGKAWQLHLDKPSVGDMTCRVTFRSPVVVILPQLLMDLSTLFLSGYQQSSFCTTGVEDNVVPEASPAESKTVVEVQFDDVTLRLSPEWTEPDNFFEFAGLYSSQQKMSLSVRLVLHSDRTEFEYIDLTGGSLNLLSGGVPSVLCRAFGFQIRGSQFGIVETENLEKKRRVNNLTFDRMALQNFTVRASSSDQAALKAAFMALAYGEADTAEPPEEIDRRDPEAKVFDSVMKLKLNFSVDPAPDGTMESVIRLLEQQDQVLSSGLRFNLSVPMMKLRMTSGLGPTQYRCETKALGLDMFAYDWRTNNWDPVLGRSRWHFCHEQVVQNGQVLQDNTIRAKDPVSVVLSANSLRCYNNVFATQTTPASYPCLLDGISLCGISCDVTSRGDTVTLVHGDASFQPLDGVLDGNSNVDVLTLNLVTGPKSSLRSVVPCQVDSQVMGAVRWKVNEDCLLACRVMMPFPPQRRLVLTSTVCIVNWCPEDLQVQFLDKEGAPLVSHSGKRMMQANLCGLHDRCAEGEVCKKTAASEPTPLQSAIRGSVVTIPTGFMLSAPIEAQREHGTVCLQVRSAARAEDTEKYSWSQMVTTGLELDARVEAMSSDSRLQSHWFHLQAKHVCDEAGGPQCVDVEVRPTFALTNACPRQMLIWFAVDSELHLREVGTVVRSCKSGSVRVEDGFGEEFEVHMGNTVIFPVNVGEQSTVRWKMNNEEHQFSIDWWQTNHLEVVRTGRKLEFRCGAKLLPAGYAQDTESGAFVIDAQKTEYTRNVVAGCLAMSLRDERGSLTHPTVVANLMTTNNRSYRQVVSGHVAEVPIHFGHFFHTETSATQEQDFTVFMRQDKERVAIYARHWFANCTGLDVRLSNAASLDQPALIDILPCELCKHDDGLVMRLLHDGNAVVAKVPAVGGSSVVDLSPTLPCRLKTEALSVTVCGSKLSSIMRLLPGIMLFNRSDIEVGFRQVGDSSDGLWLASNASAHFWWAFESLDAKPRIQVAVRESPQQEVRWSQAGFEVNEAYYGAYPMSFELSKSTLVCLHIDEDNSGVFTITVRGQEWCHKFVNEHDKAVAYLHPGDVASVCVQESRDPVWTVDSKKHAFFATPRVLSSARRLGLVLMDTSRMGYSTFLDVDLTHFCEQSFNWEKQEYLVGARNVRALRSCHQVSRGVIQTAERRAEADGIVKVVIKDRVAEVTLCVAPRDLREATQCTSFFAVSVPALAIALRRTPQMQANIQEWEACTLRFTGVSMEQETAPDNTRKSVFEIEGLQVDLHQPRTCVVLASMPETGRPFLRLKALRSDVAAAGHDLPMLNVMLGRFEVNVTHTIIKHFSLIYEDLFPHAIGMSFERAAADAGKEYHLLCTQPPEACSKFTVDRFNFADFNSLWFIRINLQEAGYLPNWVRVLIQMASFSVTSEFSVEGLSTKIPQFSPMITDYRGSMGGFISEFGARLLSLAQKRAASVLKHSNIFRMKDLYKIFLGMPDQKWTLDVRASPCLCERTRAGHWELVRNSVAGASGLTAPLTEEGFQSVWHESKDPEEMALFVRRILADVGHEVKWRTKDPLKRWVSNMKGTKSLASLKKELFFARIGMWHHKANLSHLDHFLASKRTYECRFQFDEDGDASE